jgi:Predicted integral membrane protein
MSAIPPPERPRWSVALIVSLCVNLLLAGIIAMAAFRFAFHPPLPMMGGPGFHGQPERQQIRLLLAPRGLMHVVPEKRDAIQAVLEPHHARMDALRADSLAARREVLRLYAAPTLDKPALDKAFARMLETDAAIEAELVKMSSDVGTLLTADERKKVLEWRGHGFHDWRGRDGDGPRGDGPRGDRPPPQDH